MGIWLSVIDLFGEIKWNKSLGDRAAQGFIPIDNTEDGTFIAGNRMYSSGEKTGDYTAYILMVDDFGRIYWDMKIQSENSTRVKMLITEDEKKMCIVLYEDHKGQAFLMKLEW